ncbi:MAG: Crp/Fnr family transcriptional regulator [Cytophagales bacterium]|nr:MAG: Crp/Fnr family transcriptional regulator [Cytophagales bacterium]
MIESNILDFFAKYVTLDAESISSFLAVFHKINLEKNDYLLTEGQVAEGIYMITKGCTKGFYEKDGKEIIVGFGFENDIITSYYSFISRKPSFENIQALEDTELWGIKYEDVQILYEKHHHISELGRKLAEKYYLEMAERSIILQNWTAKERYNYFFKTKPQALQRISLKQIASYLAITPEHLSRIRAEKDIS